MKIKLIKIISCLIATSLIGCCGANRIEEKSAPVITIETTEENTTEIETTEEITTITTVDVIATAYCPCKQCCGKSDGITATGVKAIANHTIAVDPNMFPYGTRFEYNGIEYVAEDCGGSIKENRIDIYFDSHKEALEFGRQHITLTIIAE